jgi:hypothetical protein
MGSGSSKGASAAAAAKASSSSSSGGGGGEPKKGNGKGRGRTLLRLPSSSCFRGFSPERDASSKLPLPPPPLPGLEVTPLPLCFSTSLVNLARFELH